MFKDRMQKIFSRLLRRQGPHASPEAEPVQDLQSRLQHISELYPSEEPSADAAHVKVYDVDVSELDLLSEHERMLGTTETQGLNHWASKRKKTQSSENLKFKNQAFEYSVDPGRAPSKVGESSGQFQSTSGIDYLAHLEQSSFKNDLSGVDTRRSAQLKPVPEPAQRRPVVHSKAIAPAISDAAVREMLKLESANGGQISRSLSSLDDEEKDTSLADRWDCSSSNSLFALPDASSCYGTTTEYEEDFEEDLLPYFTESLLLQEAEFEEPYAVTDEILPLHHSGSATQAKQYADNSGSDQSGSSGAASSSRFVAGGAPASAQSASAGAGAIAGADAGAGAGAIAEPDAGAGAGAGTGSGAGARATGTGDGAGAGSRAGELTSAQFSAPAESTSSQSSASGISMPTKSAVSGSSTSAPPAAATPTAAGALLNAATESSTALQPYKSLSENALKLIAQKPETPAPTLKWLASHANPHIRAAVAKNPSTPCDTVTVLAKDHEAGIRHAIAENTLSPMEALNLLTKDRNPLIAWRAQNTVSHIVTMQNAAQKAREAALQESQKEMHYHVKEAKIATTEETIAFLQVIARKTNTPARRLEDLAKHADARVRAAVAENANAPAAILWLLSKDADSAVKTKVTDNYNCPIEILEAMKEDEDAYVAYQAHSQLNRVLGSTFNDNHIRTATWP